MNQKGNMKRTLMLIAIGSSLVLSGPVVRADDAANAATPSREGKRHLKGPPREHLLPPAVVEKLNLTEEQKAKVKEIETAFLKTAQEYRAAHKTEIEAARTAMKEAHDSKDKAKQQAAREQMRTVMQGMQPQRQAAIEQIKSNLNDEQKAILEQAKQKAAERAASKGVRAGSPK